MKNILFLFLFSCGSFKNNFSELEIINESNITYGKCGLSYEEIEFVSKKFNLNDKFITSSIYSLDIDRKSNYVINDKTFNYSFFDTNNLEIKKNVKLYAKSYFYKDTKKYLIFKIE